MVSLVYSTRRGDITDLEAIAKLESTPETTPWLGETGLEWHRRGFADPDREHLLIESPAGLVGFVVLAGLMDPARVLEIRRIVVAEHLRGQGIGRLLIRAAIERAYERHSATRLWLDVKATNVRARGLYESEGFVVSRTVPSGWARTGDNSDLVVMEHVRSSATPAGGQRPTG
jgi:diamine N-acetyltransferase